MVALSTNLASIDASRIPLRPLAVQLSQAEMKYNTSTTKLLQGAHEQSTCQHQSACGTTRTRSQDAAVLRGAVE